MMALFSAFGGDFPSIALIVLHSLKGLTCSPVSPRTVSMFVVLVCHLLQGGHGRISRSEVIACSHIF